MRYCSAQAGVTALVSSKEGLDTLPFASWSQNFAHRFVALLNLLFLTSFCASSSDFRCMLCPRPSLTSPSVCFRGRRSSGPPLRQTLYARPTQAQWNLWSGRFARALQPTRALTLSFGIPGRAFQNCWSQRRRKKGPSNCQANLLIFRFPKAFALQRYT